MARDLSMTISICSSMDGRVRLTTKHGATFDAVVARHAFNPRSVILEPIGFSVSFGDYTPETLQVRLGNLREADRATGALPPPDVDVVRKACEWPNELPPKTTAAAVKRAEQALADPATYAPGAVRLAVEAGATKGLPAVVARLGADDRRRAAEHAVDVGADGPLRALVDGADLDLPMLLARAAYKGKLRSVEALLDAGADPDAIAGHFAGGTPRSVLLHAVYEGHRAVVRLLLARGAHVVDAGALVWAVVNTPDATLWSLLVAAGLDVNARDGHGDPLLFVLGRNAHLDMVATAIAAGANVNAVYPDGSTLLLHAIDLAMRPSPCTSFVKALLDAGADPNAGRLRGRNPLALARVLTHDPGLQYGKRWVAGYLEEVGAVAEEDTDAPAVVPEAPPPPPVWRARIDPALRRSTSYEVLGVTFTPGPTTATMEAARFPSWCGLGCDDIAVVRAKLEHLVGPPPSRRDAYKSTFEYSFVATVDDARLDVNIYDWKAANVWLAVEAHAEHDRVVTAFIELLTVAPLAPFRDRFRYDAESGRAYHSDGERAFAEFAKG